MRGRELNARTASTSRSSSDKQEPIRLAGRRVLPLSDAIARSATESALPEPRPVIVALDREETRVIQALADGVKPEDLPRRLGMDLSRVVEIKRNLGAKGKSAYALRPGASSMKLSYCERLPGGKTCWSLHDLPKEFSEIMFLERKQTTYAKR